MTYQGLFVVGKKEGRKEERKGGRTEGQRRQE